MPADRIPTRLAQKATALLLAVAGLVHLLPVPGVLGGEWLTRLYGVDVNDAGLVLLLRHRALLFGLLGVLLIAAAWRASLQMLAICAGLVSAVAFLLLAGDPRVLAPALLRVWLADIIAVACLAGAWALRPARDASWLDRRITALRNVRASPRPP